MIFWRREGVPIDNVKLPHLGEILSICLEACGYRLSPGTTIFTIGADVFRCDSSGLTKRFNGATGITSVQRSRLISHLGLDAEGVFPDDLLLAPKEFRAKLKAQSAGIYGRSASLGLMKGVRDFEGPVAQLDLVKEVVRESGFTSAPEDGREVHRYLLQPGQAIRFHCRGPDDARLLLLDHAADGRSATILSPVEAGEWARRQASGIVKIPDEIDPPLRARTIEGNRHVSAVWATRDYAHFMDQSARYATENAEYRDLDPPVLDNLTKALEGYDKSRILAASILTYRINAV